MTTLGRISRDSPPRYWAVNSCRRFMGRACIIHTERVVYRYPNAAMAQNTPKTAARHRPGVSVLGTHTAHSNILCRSISGSSIQRVPLSHLWNRPRGMMKSHTMP